MNQTISSKIETKFSKEKPPIYEKCVKKFGVDWEDGVIFTYGDTIHCKYNLHPVKVIHEETHIKQQSLIGKDKWWKLYFKDKKFRLEQELEAYQNESKWIDQNVKDRNLKFQMIYQNTRDICSSMYGNIISFDEASKLLK